MPSTRSADIRMAITMMAEVPQAECPRIRAIIPEVKNREQAFSHLEVPLKVAGAARHVSGLPSPRFFP